MRLFSFLTIIVVFLMTIAPLSAQNIITVNSNTDFPSDYTDLQEAIDTSNAGTIILVMGSGLTYGNIEIDKQIAIYGPGYFLGQNEEPWTQATTGQAEIGTLTFKEGSSGAYVSGMVINSLIRFETVSNVTLTNNRCFSSISAFSGSSFPSNIVIEKNYITSSSLFISNCSGVVYKNNIIVGASSINFASNSSVTGLVVDNNTIATNTGGNAFVYALNGTISNNVFVELNEAGNVSFIASGAPAIVLNNISSDSTLLANYPSNDSDISPEDIFVDWANPTFYSSDFYYSLSATSPAVGFGTNGQDAGAYGGSDPYIPSGIPDIPHIYFLDIPNAGSSLDGLEIIIKAKAN